MKESTPDQDSNSSSLILEQKDSKGCFCAKKQCMLGIASIAIGIGGFVVSLLI
ncbi:MAG TPA: hypothetical protein VFG25_01475 [Nitrosopumilaceae archaeon]|nr:hypothetical protein [Nitrosopumilaceae archaeon]